MRETTIQYVIQWILTSLPWFTAIAVYYFRFRASLLGRLQGV